jgi:Domain of unknown function (DUF4292)
MNRWRLRRGFWLLAWASCFQACCPVPQKGIRKNGHWVQTLDFEYLKMSTNVGYQDHAHQYSSAHVKFRIKKDHLIWFSVLAPWGIEILRGLITPTSITLLNHMQKSCYVHDYATLRALWPGPWDYALLQSLLLGELAHASTLHKVTQQNTQQAVIQQQKEAWTLTHFIHPIFKKVEKLVAATGQGSCVATYDQFKPCQGGLLFRRATLTWYHRTAPTQPVMTLTLKGMQAQWSKKPLHFPCSIPAHYEKKQVILDW